MRVRFIPIFLVLAVLFTFIVRATFLWRDFVFVYDQGRDALQVDQILHGNMSFVGPTTGLFGVFLGPFYYYLLAPLYFIGQGNPIVPAYVFVLLSAITIVPLFYLTRRIAGTSAGVFASGLYAFSFVQWQYARWLSNPNPLPFDALIMFFCVMRALETRKKLWFAMTGLLLGLCLQLEAANAFFLIPTLFCILIIEYWIAYKNHGVWKHLMVDWQRIAYAAVAFGVTLIPQVLFELKHGFPITHAILKAFQDKSDPSVALNIPVRIKLLFDLYAQEWFFRVPWRDIAFALVLVGTGFVFLFVYKKLCSIQAFRIVSVWFCVPLLFHILYNGNHGNFWDYYIIGQYITLHILVASILITGLRHFGSVRYVSIVFIVLTSVFVAIPNTREWLGLFTPFNDRISLSLQLDAVDWAEARAGGQPFGVWAYTPSAQDEVYRYLFEYRARTTGIIPVEHPENTRHMYLLVEDDPNNPKRRLAWIAQMSAIGSIDAQAKFGAISVFEVIRK